jgi:hypothetical protein
MPLTFLKYPTLYATLCNYSTSYRINEVSGIRIFWIWPFFEAVMSTSNNRLRLVASIAAATSSIH